MMELPREWLQVIQFCLFLGLRAGGGGEWAGGTHGPTDYGGGQSFQYRQSELRGMGTPGETPSGQ